MAKDVDLLVRRDDLRVTELRERPAAVPSEGQVALRIDAFAMTANNITYAVFGDAMRYWDFFPAAEGWGRVPVWGYATVTASRHAEIGVGERLYGYLPMASGVVVEPGKVSAGLFTDMAAHRQALSPIYNQYRRLAADPAHDGAHEAERMLFEPLFLTAMLIEIMFRDADWHGAGTVILTSASSKTAMALAHGVRARSPGIERIGLTSARNRAFVESTGLYDRVLDYGGIGSIDRAARAVSVDFAGDGAVLHALHAHMGDALAYSCLVGATHWQERGGAGQMPGPTPVLFFAPDHAAALIGRIGMAAFQRMVAECWADFVGVAAGLVTVERGVGGDAVRRTYHALIDGTANPQVGHIMAFK